MTSKVANFFINSNKRGYLIIGASASPHKFGFKILQWYLNHPDLNIFPINPTKETILNTKTYPSITQAMNQATTDAGICCSFITPPAVSLASLHELSNFKDLIKSLWFQPGSYDSKVIEYCQDELGLKVEDGSLIYKGHCILVEGDDALFKAKELKSKC